MPIGGSVAGYRVPAAPYVGPADIVSGATVWWGLRAYSNSALGSNVIRLRRSSDNAEQDFATVTGGGLDTSAITSFKGAASLFIVKLYDQTGGGRHVNQGTAANQPVFTLSDLGTLPTAAFTTFPIYLQSLAANVTVVQPETCCIVCITTGSFTTQSIYAAVGGLQLIGAEHGGVANNLFSYAGGTGLDATCADNTWHAVAAVINSSAANININGSVTSGTLGTNTGTDNGYYGSPSQPFTGKLNEVGWWPVGFTGTQSTNMVTNQQ